MTGHLAKASLLAFLTAGTTACASPPRLISDPHACPGDCDTVVHVAISSSFTESERVEVWRGLDAWQSGTGQRVCFRAGAPDLRIERASRRHELAAFDPEWPNHVGYYHENQAHIVIGDGNVAGIMAHEAGHHLGFNHSTDEGSVMRAAGGRLAPGGALPLPDVRAFCDAKGCACRP